MFLDTQGRIILSTEEENVGRNYFEINEIPKDFTVGEDEYIQDVFLNGKSFEMAFSNILNKVDLESMSTSDEVIASVVIRINLEESLFNILENWPGKGQSGELLLINTNNVPNVYISPLRFLEGAAMQEEVSQGLADLQAEELQDHEYGKIDLVNDYRDVQVARAYRVIDHTGWLFVIKQDQSEVFAPVVNLTRIWIALSLITFGIAVAIASYLSRSLFEPLKELTKAARDVESGDFETQVKMDRNDEFGELSRAFNSMVLAIQDNNETIRKNYDELQALVNLSSEFLGSLNIRETLENALSEAISATSAEAGLVFLKDNDAEEISLEAQLGLTPKIIGKQLPLDALTASGYVMINRKTVTTFDAGQENKYRMPPFIVDLDVKSNMAVPMLIEDRVIGAIVLDTFEHYQFTQAEVDLVQTIANQTAIAIERIKLIGDLEESYDRTLTSLANALDARDRETEGHSERVMAYTKAMARKMDISPDDLQDLGRGALLHDIGKIGVPDAILHKPDRLNEKEWASIEKHPEWGKQIIGGIPFLKVPSEMVLSHHERWDGEGYPNGLSGKNIPIGARIFAIVDAFDAMTSNRPYRKALSYDEAIEEIKRGRGSQFDPNITDIFLSFHKSDWQQIRNMKASGQGKLEVKNIFEMGEIRNTKTGQLNALNAIIGAITSSLDMKDVMNNTVEALVQLTRASSAGVFLYEKNLDRIEDISDYAFPSELIAELDKCPINEFFGKEIIRHGKTIVSQDISEIAVFNELRLQEIYPNWASHICIPLAWESEVVGLMMLFSDRTDSFSKEDQGLFEQVGKQLGQSVVNVREHEHVRTQALTDDLTGAYNRRFVNDFLDLEVKRSNRYKRPLAVIMMDVDYFKACNDRAGHQAGDKVLVAIVQILNLGVRNVDMVARYGGEEFLMVLPETNLEKAVDVAERLRSLIENHDFECGKLTASFGVAAYDFSDKDDLSIEAFINRADEALMSAKHEGRNRVFS